MNLASETEDDQVEFIQTQPEIVQVASNNEESQASTSTQRIETVQRKKQQPTLLNYFKK